MRSARPGNSADAGRYLERGTARAFGQQATAVRRRMHHREAMSGSDLELRLGGAIQQGGVVRVMQVHELQALAAKQAQAAFDRAADLVGAEVARAWIALGPGRQHETADMPPSSRNAPWQRHGTSFRRDWTPAKRYTLKLSLARSLARPDGQNMQWWFRARPQLMGRLAAPEDMVRRVHVLGILALGLALVTAQPTGCTYQLGFAALHGMLPAIIGDCVTDETFDPATGDTVQESTGGLLVWRKEDNWTAFTNGSQTWVNGPLGLQERANTQRFWWEGNPEHLTIVPAPVDGDRCHTSGLSLSLVRTDVGAGNRVATFRLTNNLDVSCTFFGFPGAQLFDGMFTPLPTTVVRGGGSFSNPNPTNSTPTTVSVGPHQAATFLMHWEVIPVNDEPTCLVAARIVITPPDELDPLPLAMQIQACGGGELDVSPIQPDGAS